MLQVLLVEDEPNLRHSIERALRHLGAEVFAVSTGVEALAVLRTHDIAAVLSDIALGDDPPDGFDVLLFARLTRPRAVRVLMSGNRSTRIAVALDDGLIEEFLLKPFGLETVGTLLRMATDRLRP